MNTLDHFTRRSTGCHSKTPVYLSKYPPSLSVSLMVPSCHHTCHPVSLCTVRLAVSVPVQTGKSPLLFCARRKLKGLWLPVVFCSGSPCPKQLFCSHLTLQFSLTVQNFSRNPFLYFCLLRVTKKPCHRHWKLYMYLYNFAADLFTDRPAITALVDWT